MLQAKPFERIPLLEQAQKTLAGEARPSKVSEDMMSEVELALMILEREGLNTRDQTKEELNKVKSRLKKQSNATTPRLVIFTS